MNTIDARHSRLLDKDVKALQNLTLAQAHNNKFGLFLYKEIAELDPDRMRVIDTDIDQTVTDFHATIDEAKRESPGLTSEVNAAAALFDQEVADARPVRVATQAQQKDKAMKLMPAALIASMLKIALAAQSAHADDPARVLQGLNQALCGKFQHHYVTASYVFVDMEELTLSYAGAGHPPLLLWGTPSSSGVRDVTENGLFLGMFSFATYSSLKVPLAPGDRGLMYTDGISETNNPEGAEFGSKRFRQFLEAQKTGSANQLADSLLEELARWSARGENQDLDDDITMVTIHVTDVA